MEYALGGEKRSNLLKIFLCQLCTRNYVKTVKPDYLAARFPY